MSSVDKSDLKLLKLVYYGIDFSSIDESDIINKTSNIYYILKEYSLVIEKLNQNGRKQQLKQIIEIQDLDLDNELTEDEYIAAAAINNNNSEFIEKVKQSIANISKFENDLTYDHEKLTLSIVLGHLYFLIEDNDKALRFLNKVGKIENSQIKDFRFDIFYNYFISCEFMSKTLKLIITKDFKTIINEISVLDIPIFSNFKAKFWFDNCVEIFCLQLNKSNSIIKFSQFKEVIKDKNLLIIVSLIYYNKFGKDEEFIKFFSDYINEKYYNNKALKFPNSHYSEDTENEYSLFVYWLVSWNTNNLINNTYLEELNQFLINKTYHSITTHYNLIVLKIQQFKKLNTIFDENLEDKFGKVNEVLSILQNFEDFYEKLKLKVVKKNDDSADEIEFDDLSIINLYSKFIDFFVNIYQGDYKLLISISSIRININRMEQLRKYYKLYELGNLNYLKRICGKLSSTLDGITMFMNVSTKSFQIHSISYNISSSTNILLSKGYHSLLDEKIFCLKSNFRNELQKFLSEGSSDSNEGDSMSILSDFQKCINLNGFSNLDYYFDLIIFLLRFYDFDKFSKLILNIIQTGLKKDIMYWKFWNLLLILVNSNYGISISSIIGNNNKRDYEVCENENSSINSVVNNLINNYLLKNKDTITNTSAEMKKDLMQLKFTQLATINNEDDILSLSKVNELFELFNDLFNIDNANNDDDSPNIKQKTMNHLVVKSDDDNPVLSNGTSTSLFRFNTFKRSSRQAIKNKSISINKPIKKKVTQSTEDNNNNDELMDENTIIQRILLSEIWVFISRLYLEKGLYKESEETIDEALNCYCSLNAWNQKVRLDNKKKNETIEDIYIQEFINSCANLNCLHFGESIIEYTNNILTKELITDNSLEEEEEEEEKNKFYINDLMYIKNPDIEDEEDTLLGTISLSDVRINGKKNSSAKLTSDEIVDEIKLLRCKTLIEDNLINNYYYFNDLNMWNCLAKIYFKINDMTKYEYALKKVIYAEESSLIRNLNQL